MTIRQKIVLWWLVCFGSCALYAGCGVYLHDEGLQKQTDTLLETYKTADVAGAMKAAIAAQQELDKAELQAVVDNETAERDRAVADLIASYPLYNSDLAITRLKMRVDDRIRALTDVAVDDTWLGMNEKLIGDVTLVDSTRRAVLVLQRRYVAAGGFNFVSCDTFGGADGVPEALQTSARQLKTQCDSLAKLTKPTGSVQNALNAVFASKGEINDVHAARQKSIDEVKAVTEARDKVLKDLREAQKELKEATKDNTSIDIQVTEKLDGIKNKLDEIDGLAGALTGSGASLGNALAAIQFRKTNLRDVLAASTGQTATGAASDAKRAIVGVVAGMSRVAKADDAPSVPALSIALAYQDGLEKASSARLDTLTQQKELLENQENALLRELELLVTARKAIVGTGNGLTSGSCMPRGFVEVFQTAGCPAVARAAGARALTAYYLSWASGRTAARLADRRVTQLIGWQNLRASQEAAIARSNIQLIALKELAAYGQGGIKPETIAAFLQAFGIAAIAKGVN